MDKWLIMLSILAYRSAMRGEQIPVFHITDGMSEKKRHMVWEYEKYKKE